ncbi:MAG TPA: hypothetical protein VMF89_06210, partial [Polyangiales bacterium]|nr:hypothetical protein [Polyangiales bacterium]
MSPSARSRQFHKLRDATEPEPQQRARGRLSVGTMLKKTLVVDGITPVGAYQVLRKEAGLGS